MKKECTCNLEDADLHEITRGLFTCIECGGEKKVALDKRNCSDGAMRERSMANRIIELEEENTVLRKENIELNAGMRNINKLLKQGKHQVSRLHAIEDRRIKI